MINFNKQIKFEQDLLIEVPSIIDTKEAKNIKKVSYYRLFKTSLKEWFKKK